MANLSNVIKISETDFNRLVEAYPGSVDIGGTQRTWDPNAFYLVEAKSLYQHHIKITRENYDIVVSLVLVSNVESPVTSASALYQLLPVKNYPYPASGYFYYSSDTGRELFYSVTAVSSDQKVHANYYDVIADRFDGVIIADSSHEISDTVILLKS